MAKKVSIELSDKKSREEEGKFYELFSSVQVNVTLFTILSSTFLIEGAVRIFELSGRAYLLQGWFAIVVVAICLFVLSLFALSLANVFAILKLKRRMNILSYVLFLGGIGFFLASLLYILVNVLKF